jgi:predicted DNA-binding ribbon-helix-helix protein
METNTLTRPGMIVRVDLTAAEWKRAKALAKRRRLYTNQLIGQLIRDALAQDKAAS